MKRLIIASLILLSAAFSASAVPAFPGKVYHKGPDGREIAVYLHGDEYCHWATDESGREVSILKDGSVEILPATRSSSRRHVYDRRRVFYPEVGPLTMGERHFLVVLVEFSDCSFSLSNPKDRFTRMLNDDAYSDFGGTGSAHKYYSQQSTGKFNPIFDVIGPIKVSGKVADYGENEKDEETGKEIPGSDKDPTGCFLEAVKLAHNAGLVNLSDYDTNNDGYVDNIFFYYAGYNEAEHAPGETIWPHAFGFWGSYSTVLDGVALGRYSCSSELRGNDGANMCGIGTFCHEFGHVLGLPDFYDTDYDENGSAADVYHFSLMCSGNYNNDGCSPPNLSAIERNMLGWMDFPVKWTESGHKTIKPITANEAFYLDSTNEGEYFLLEVRDGTTGWDKYITGSPSGMLIYHVDQSYNIVGDSKAYSLWYNYHGINCWGNHPCYYIVPASYEKKYSSYVFPGSKGKTEFGGGTNPSNKDYNNGFAGFELTNIAMSGSSVEMDLEIIHGLKIKGKVTDSSGKPLGGVTVSVNDSSPEPAPRFSLGRLHSKRAAQLASAVGACVTAEDGTYEVEVSEGKVAPFEVVYSRSYYYSRSEKVYSTRGTLVRDMSLKTVGETETYALQKYEHESDNSVGVQTTPQSLTAAVRFTPEQLAGYVGCKINEIGFFLYCRSSVEEVSVFVDYGLQRQFSKVVPKPSIKGANTVDISEANLYIPADTDVYIGFSYKNADYGYPIGLSSDEPVEGSCILGDGYMFTPTAEEGWDDKYQYQFNLLIRAAVESSASPFAQLGIKVISNPGGLKAGDEFFFRFEAEAGKTPASTAWYFDSLPQSASSTVLESGRHEVKAVCTYSDGSTEEIVQIIEVQ